MAPRPARLRSVLRVWFDVRGSGHGQRRRPVVGSHARARLMAADRRAKVPGAGYLAVIVANLEGD